MKRKYIVKTHLGDFETWAVSASKALSNVRWRLFGCRGYAPTKYWKVRAAQ